MRWQAGIASIGVVLVGCSTTVAGSAGSATTAVKILPTDSEITSAVGNTLSTFGFQPTLGGAEILPDGYRTDTDATPIGCAAVTDTAPRIVYEPLPVVEVARLSYFNWDEGVDASGADAAVVRLATGDAAHETFESFARQWQKCGGTTVVKHLRGTGNAGTDSGTGAVIDANINDVTVAGPVLSATVRTRQRPGSVASRYERAVGMRGTTLVEVSLAITPAGEQKPDPRGRAVRLTQLMLDKVGPGS